MATLVIGGSGMLKAASKWLLEHRDEVILCGRHQARYADILTDNAHGTFVRHDFSSGEDWHRLAVYVQRREIDEILLWVHSAYDALVLTFLDALPKDKPCAIVWLRGSTSAPVPSLNHAHHTVYTVRLGWHRVQSRWLSHDEISAAAITALSERRALQVGDVAHL